MHLKNIGILIPIALTLISRGFDWQEVIISSLQLVTYRKQSANNDPFHWCDMYSPPICNDSNRLPPNTCCAHFYIINSISLSNRKPHVGIYCRICGFRRQIIGALKDWVTDRLCNYDILVDCARRAFNYIATSHCESKRCSQRPT